MRLQIQSRRYLGTPGNWSRWIVEPTGPDGKRNLDIAILKARVIEDEGWLYKKPCLIQIVRRSWLFGSKVVWRNF